MAFLKVIFEIILKKSADNKKSLKITQYSESNGFKYTSLHKIHWSAVYIVM